MSTFSAPGLWLNKIGSDMGSFDGWSEEATLSSNGAEEHLALAVKYPGDTIAFLVTPNSAFELSRGRGWRLPSAAMEAGQYFVSVLFQSDGGSRSEVQVQVRIRSTDNEITGEVLTLRSRF